MSLLQQQMGTSSQLGTNVVPAFCAKNHNEQPDMLPTLKLQFYTKLSRGMQIFFKRVFKRQSTVLPCYQTIKEMTLLILVGELSKD